MSGELIFNCLTIVECVCVGDCIVFASWAVARSHCCLVFKHTRCLQPIPKAVVPQPKDIKVICCDDEQTALSWTAGVRLAKYGLQLRDNFHKAKMTQFKLEDLAAPEGSQPNADVSETTPLLL